MRAIPSRRALFSSHLTRAPGKPPHASTASPESSTRTARPSRSKAVRAFASATSAGSSACGSGRSRSTRSSGKPSRSASSAFSGRPVTNTGTRGNPLGLGTGDFLGGGGLELGRFELPEDLVERNLLRNALQGEESELRDAVSVADRFVGGRTDHDV